MIPIVRHSRGEDNKSYSFDSFEQEFHHICEAHRSQGRAMAFAFILYDKNSPEIKKVLNDPDYWDSLSIHCLEPF